MALSEQVALNISTALEQLKVLDKSLAKSLRGNVTVDIGPALEDVKILREVTQAALTSRHEINLSTKAATKTLSTFEAKIKAFRRLAEKSININLSATAINRANNALEKLSATSATYAKQAIRSSLAADIFTAALEKQVVEAGLLSKELKDVAVSAEAIRATTGRTRPTQLGPGRAELNTILREQKEFEARIGRNVADSTLGPITAGRITAIKEAEAAVVEAQAAERVSIAETAAAQKKADAESVASARVAAKERIAAEREVAAAAKLSATKAAAEARATAAAATQGRAPGGLLLGPINNSRVLGLEAEAAAQKEASRVAAKGAREAEAAEKKAAAGLRGLRTESQSLNQQLIGTGRSLTLLFTLPAVVAGAFAAFNEFKFQETIQRTKVLTDAFTKFDAEGRKVNLTTAETNVRIAGLRDVFNSISSKTGQTPNEIAKGFYFVASAGGAAATRLSILRVAAQGAAVGLGTVEVVADALTSVLNSYGEANITAASAGDILVKAVNDAKVEASALAPQLGRVLPIAAELGINFAQVAESLALLTQNGNDASTASTQLRGILQTLIRPTSQKAADILASVGLSVAQLKEQVSKPTSTAFIDTLIKLRQTLPIEEFSQLFRRVDALNGALSLTNNADAIRGFREIAEAAKNTSGDLQEFERFTANNRVVEIKQAFSQLLQQIQPLGQKILPLVAEGIGAIVQIIDKLARLVKTPILGPIILGLGAMLAASGPLIFGLGKVRQAIIAIGKVQTVLGTSGGFARFLKGEQVADIARTAEGAAAPIGRVGKAIGVLPGLFGLAAAGGIAFFSGAAIASGDLKTKLLGVVGSLAAVGLAYKAAGAAAAALGASSALAGGIGIVAGLVVAGVSAFSAYKTAVEKSHKALVEFQKSLVGLTANEAVKSFGASLTKSLTGITADDRVTKIEIPELKKALDSLGLSYEDLGQKLLDVVLANPDDLKAQQNSLRGLAEQINKPLGANRGSDLVSRLNDINQALADSTKNERANGFGPGESPLGRAFAALKDGEVLTSDVAGSLGKSLEAIGVSTDEVSESMSLLASKGLLEFRNGILSIPTDKIDEAKKALSEAFGPDTANLLSQQAEAFRLARQSALDSTGEFTTAINKAGEFKTEIEDGVEVQTFVSNVDEAVVTLDALTKALDGAVAAVFGIRDSTTVSSLADTLAQAAKKRAEELIALQNPTDKSFINFKVDLTSPAGLDARQYIRDQIDGIDKVIAPFLSGPNADINLALQIRDQQVGVLASQVGFKVKDLNAFLASDRGGTSTAQIRLGLDQRSAQQAIDDIANLKRLIDASPLTQQIKLNVKDDTTGDLFGSELINKAVRSGGKVLVDFVVEAQAKGTSLEQLQAIFASAPVDQVRNVLFEAIDKGSTVKELSQFVAGLPSKVQFGLQVNAPTFIGVGTDVSDLDKQRFLFNKNQEKQIIVNTVVEGAQAYASIDSLATGLTAQAQNALNVAGGIEIPAVLQDIDTSGVDAARDAAIAATGEFVFATDAAGSFVTTLDESGSTITTFRGNIDKTVTSISGLSGALDTAVQAVFGLRNKTFASEASDQLTQLATTRATDLANATEKTTKAQAAADVATAKQAAADARSAKATQDNQVNGAVEAARIVKEAAQTESDAAAEAARLANNPDATAKTPREVAADAAVAAADEALRVAQASSDATDAAARSASADAAVAAADEGVRAAQAKATAAEGAGVNFQVGLIGPDAVDARQFVRDQVDKIDGIIAPLLSGPDADIPLALGLRDTALADLTAQTGFTVDQLNAFLETDRGGTTTVQLQTRLVGVGADDAAKALKDAQDILAASPLTAEVKAAVTVDQTGVRFRDELLALGLGGDGKQLVDFIINLETVGIPVKQIQDIFAGADPGVVHDFIVNAINRGVPIEDISKAITGIPPEIRTGLIIDAPKDKNGDPVVLPSSSTEFKVNAVLTGAADFAALNSDITEPGAGDFPVTAVVNDDEYTTLLNQIADGANLSVLATVEPSAYNAMIKQVKDGLAALGIVAGNAALTPDLNAQARNAVAGAESGAIFGGSGFRAFRDGGMINGSNLPRVPMFGRAPSNKRGILWGEPQTHKEAYIPYNPARRVRAMALVSRVAKDFGMDVHTARRAAISQNGATLDGERYVGKGDGREIAQLAGQVATLAKVIEERETQPMIGELNLESKTTNPQATARYLATHVLKAIR